jgi:AraC-like DNA-binding protein
VREDLHFRRYDTPGIAPRDRFDFWRTWYSEAVESRMELGAIDAVPEHFQASAEALHVGGTGVVEIRSGRAAGKWARDATEPGDLVRLVLFVSASGMTGSWHGEETALSRGRLLLCRRAGAGFWRAPAGFHAIQLNVPRSTLPVPDAVLNRLTEQQVPVRGPVADGLVRPLLSGMSGHLEHLSRMAGAELAQIWISVLVLLLRSLDEPDRRLDAEEVVPARRLQALRFIDANLGDPDLGPDSVAAALHVSRRTLYRALAADGASVAAIIRRRRLERSRVILTDPARRHWPAARVAAEVGLGSAAHFSRLFRAAYGETPGDVRSHPQERPARAPGVESRSAATWATGRSRSARSAPAFR